MNPIPCSERLPEIWDRVIFWAEDDDLVRIGEFQREHRNAYTERTSFLFHYAGSNLSGTHWCEIPEHLKNFKPNETTTHS